MKRKQRTEILINGTADLAVSLSQDIVSRYNIVVIEEPNYGLVMVKVRETAQKSLFYLGEVLVTECKVQIEGVTGVGFVKGDDPNKAYDLAVIDAAFGADLNETAEWSTLLQQESDRLAAQQAAFQSKLLQTKVNFETMDTD
ncbi:phosphonate C-P lyase system protein PhnG [Paenibacillus marchantiophytorum]|uniref:Phosphonate C-P lyase system protein PhnG n=1 Tax=Paenibacillus marchantiophytorum TaxID=1619310 RepID=A0ABQ1EPG7_9BACL|nr:phosphonate C-P lyase system protein PhnG [Paenibacillus marchantiophytorum]GFZ79995.1 phosphonate C-P lyase system protein PhnG [Paenibacillus marchantiophytorum]